MWGVLAARFVCLWLSTVGWFAPPPKKKNNFDVFMLQNEDVDFVYVHSKPSDISVCCA